MATVLYTIELSKFCLLNRFCSEIPDETQYRPAVQRTSAEQVGPRKPVAGLLNAKAILKQGRAKQNASDQVVHRIQNISPLNRTSAVLFRAHLALLHARTRNFCAKQELTNLLGRLTSDICSQFRRNRVSSLTLSRQLDFAELRITDQPFLARVK